MKYIAYGSNMNIRQMARRCPTAKVVGTAELENWQLTFKNYATIIPSDGVKTAVVVWEIDANCEESLDRYEGFPKFYGKEMLNVNCNDEVLDCMVYIMNGNKPCMPNEIYYNAIADGYDDFGIDKCLLINAIQHTEIELKNINNVKIEGGECRR